MSSPGREVRADHWKQTALFLFVSLKYNGGKLAQHDLSENMELTKTLYFSSHGTAFFFFALDLNSVRKTD